VLALYKFLLAPVLLLQASRLRRDALRLPEAAGLRSGLLAGLSNEAPIRVLFVGDSSAAGVGVATQDRAFALPCATSLRLHTGRSVHWQLLAKSGISTDQARALVEQHRLAAADVLVTALGVNDVTSQKTPGAFLRDYRALLGSLQERTGAKIGVINGLPPMGTFLAIPNPLRWYLGQYARRLDARLRDWVATQPGLRHLPLDGLAASGELAADGYHPGPDQYRLWAERVAQYITELLEIRSA